MSSSPKCPAQSDAQCVCWHLCFSIIHTRFLVANAKQGWKTSDTLQKISPDVHKLQDVWLACCLHTGVTQPFSTSLLLARSVARTAHRRAMASPMPCRRTSSCPALFFLLGGILLSAPLGCSFCTAWSCQVPPAFQSALWVSLSHWDVGTPSASLSSSPPPPNFTH